MKLCRPAYFVRTTQYIQYKPGCDYTEKVVEVPPLVLVELRGDGLPRKQINFNAVFMTSALFVVVRSLY